MRHRNALAGLLLATATSFGGKQAVATCEFVVPTNEWVVAAHATYACQTIIPGLQICYRIWQLRWGDVFYAENQSDVPCVLGGYTYAQYPFWIEIDAVVGGQYAGVGLWTRSDSYRNMYPEELPWNCFWGFCTLGGFSVVGAYDDDADEIAYHVRPYLLTVWY